MNEAFQPENNIQNSARSSTRTPVEFVANSEHFKTIVVGDAGIGKSRLTYYFVTGRQHIQRQYYTQAYEKLLKQIKVTVIDKQTGKMANKCLNMQFHDTAGKEKFNALAISHYRKCKGALVCYSVTDLNTFQAVDKWINLVKENAGSQCPIILVGTRCDVDKSQREVQYDAGKRLAGFYGIDFFEVSVLNDYNVQEVISALARLMISEYETNIATKGGKKRMTEIGNDASFPDEVQGSFSLDCCGRGRGRGNRQN